MLDRAWAVWQDGFYARRSNHFQSLPQLRKTHHFTAVAGINYRLDIAHQRSESVVSSSNFFPTLVHIIVFVFHFQAWRSYSEKFTRQIWHCSTSRWINGASQTIISSIFVNIWSWRMSTLLIIEISSDMIWFTICATALLEPRNFCYATRRKTSDQHGFDLEFWKLYTECSRLFHTWFSFTMCSSSTTLFILRKNILEYNQDFCCALSI